jgi:phage tail-like protein
MVNSAMIGNRTDPYRAYNFKLEIMGVTEGHFTECSGIGVKVHAISYREGGTSQVVRRLPGPVEYGDITLRYGLTQSQQLWDWFLGGVKGEVARKNVSIVLVDNDGATEVMRWNLVDCWPTEWRGALLNAMSREVAIESITLVFESLERG